MLDRTSVIGGSYENGSAIFILYACVPEWNHVFFFIRAFPQGVLPVSHSREIVKRIFPCPAWPDGLACDVPCNARTGGVLVLLAPPLR
jgi:hypothetical protein